MTPLSPRAAYRPPSPVPAPAPLRAPPSARRATLKGQYFSIDAVMAAIIFIFALSLLVSHWSGLRSQLDSRSDILVSDAYRISDALMGVPQPADWTSGPGALQAASRPGLLLNQSRPQALNRTALLALQSNMNALANPNAYYTEFRRLLASSGQVYIELNLSHVGTAPPCSVLPQAFRIGFYPKNPTRVVRVQRNVVMDYTVGPCTETLAGPMAVLVWTDKGTN